MTEEPLPPPLSDSDLIKLLDAIKDIAMSFYPFGDDAREIDPELVMTLGEIAGKAAAALGRYQRRRR